MHDCNAYSTSQLPGYVRYRNTENFTLNIAQIQGNTVYYATVYPRIIAVLFPEPEFLMSPRIDSKETISPGCVGWRAGTTTLFILGS